MNNLLQKRIPTVLSVIVLVVGVLVTTILVKKGVIIFGHASPTDVPQNIRITNITDSSFTITYTTDATVVGTVNLTNTGDKPQIILDDRDQASGIPKPYNVHSISVKDLISQTPYSFSILSGTTTYLDGANPFSFTTPAKLTAQPTDQIPLAGKIVLPDGTVPTEALIFVTTDNGQLLSTLLNASGLYILPLNTMRTKDLSNLITFTYANKLTFLATNGPLTTHATLAMDGINPAPPITLSQDYDFTISSTPLASNSASAFPNFTLPSTNTYKATPQIISPKANESFADQQPQFNGTASPNSQVTVTIHSDEKITATVKTSANGTWTYRPTQQLSPGQHTITITAPDQFGILRTIQQSFTVYAAGSQVNQSATPSATLAPTKTPTKPTATPTSKQISVSPTKSAASPTLIPTATNLLISPRPTLPPTGSNTVTVVSLTGIATVIVGIVLFLVTSGASL